MFIADEVPPEFDAVVGGRCLAVPLSAIDELVRVARRDRARAMRTPPHGVPVARDRNRPTLLARRRRSGAARRDGRICSTTQGYAVTAGRERQRRRSSVLEHRDFDAIVADWHMHDGSGADVYRWILDSTSRTSRRASCSCPRPIRTTRARSRPGRPMFRKGQDSQALTDVLREIVATVRG